MGTAPPEFFVDRTTGTTVLRALREAGWQVRRISEVFPDDASDVPDEDWIAYGCQRGWALITADKRIRHQPSYRVATTPIFAFSTNNIRIGEQVRRLLTFQARIWAKAGAGRREFWIMYADRVERRDP